MMVMVAGGSSGRWREIVSSCCVVLCFLQCFVKIKHFITFPLLAIN